ncbi:hypothetical protein ACT2CV_08065 [Pasteurellaceae bacterium 22721_9_1]
MTKHDIAQEVIDIQTILECAKDCALEDKLQDAKQLLNTALLEIKKLGIQISAN